MSSEQSIQSLRDELKGNVFRGVDGFLAKYFENKPWSTPIESVITAGHEIINKLSTDLVNIANFKDLNDWLAIFHILSLTIDQRHVHIESQPLNSPGSPFSATIEHQSTRLAPTGHPTRVYGEYHHSQAPIAAGDDEQFLHFVARAIRAFNGQPARQFCHAFLLCDTTLELWVFDRSGAYSSGTLDIAQNPLFFIRTLAAFGFMSDEECGISMEIRMPEADGHPALHNQQLCIRPEAIARPDYLIGLGTACYAASRTATENPNIVVKFSWRVNSTSTELQMLQLARERKVWGVVQLLCHKDLTSIAELRQGLQFPEQFTNRTLSYILTTPFGRSIRAFKSISQLLEALRDIAKALRSLYVDGRMLHRDVAIKNLVITRRPNADSPRAFLIDFDQALDLDNARDVEPTVGSDGFMAIGILLGKPHTYRHDLESLFYVFLWLAIGDNMWDDPTEDILESITKTSRLWKWCSMDFRAVGQAKAADMSPEGFEGILGEFSDLFTPLKDIAKELHALIFPLRDGVIFTGTETDQESVERLYDGMADVFHRGALAFQE